MAQHFLTMRTVASDLRRWGSIERILAFTGGASAITGLMQFVWPDSPTRLGARVTLATLVIVAIGFSISAATRKCLTATAERRDWSIDFEVGDLFNRPRVVVTADRCFATDTASVGEKSLISQLLRITGSHDAITICQQLHAEANHDLVEPGRVVTFTTVRVSGYVLAVSAPARDGTTSTSWTELWSAYDGLWNAARAGYIDSLAVPVIGAGFAGAALDRGSVLGCLLLSFHAASIERVVCPRLRVVLPPDDAGLMLDARQLLRALGYTTKRRRDLGG